MNHRQLACFAAGWLGLCGCLTVPLRAQAQLAEKTSQQIAELLAEKQSRTPAQMKLGSHLIYAARTMRGQRLTPHVAVMPLVSKSLRMRRDRVEVDLDGEITTSLINAVVAAGGEIESALPEFHTLRAWIPLRA